MDLKNQSTSEITPKSSWKSMKFSILIAFDRRFTGSTALKAYVERGSAGSSIAQAETVNV